ncbi:unnamed protein product [Durusdinium trenchii]|uniref:Carboxylesterase type B domain-containing protein n=1 Tax=Durusdinium trenchii TaxID=1381693 RepID=A0ABP0Q701_9DINO
MASAFRILPMEKTSSSTGRWQTLSAYVLIPLMILAACVLTRNSMLQRKAANSPSVLLSCGRLSGVQDAGVAAFRGLRYGEAPLGRRRWRPAAPAACAAGEATQDGPSCRQGGGPGESEDCLNLNVFVPSRLFEGTQGAPLLTSLPVLVWIYGGMNVIGDVEFYGPIENIVRKRDCVLVAMNYRLGIFGYLALKELATVDPRGSSGNLGITDQQLALHWVQENIAAFGGDPKKVTLMGQSSGGSNVFAHLASLGSRGLFHRAISLSGSPNITMDRETKEDQDRRLILPRTPCANLSGPKLLDCLYTADAMALDRALPKSYQLFDTLYDYPTTRVGLGASVSALLHVDGVTVSAPVLEALGSGMNDVPLLLQSMQAEMACAPAKVLENLTARGLGDFLEEVFSPVYGPQVAHEINATYQHYVPPEYGAYAVDADSASACGLRALAQAAAGSFQSPVYWSTVTAQPSHPVKGQRFPFHNWDFIAASETFGAYTPSQKDLSFGARLREDWFQLIWDGEISTSGYRKVQASAPGELVGSAQGFEALVFRVLSRRHMSDQSDPPLFSCEDCFAPGVRGSDVSIRYEVLSQGRAAESLRRRARADTPVVGALWALLRGKNWQRAIQAAEKLLLEELVPREFLALMRSAGRRSAWPLSLEALETMRKRELPPDELHYTAAMRACTSADAAGGSAALRLFGEVEKPSHLTFTAAISSCGVTREWELALELLNLMALSSHPPDLVAFHAAVTVCRQARKSRLALKLIDSLRRSELQPDVVAYSAAIAACEEGFRWMRALSFLKQMDQDAVAANVVSFSSAMSACANARHWDHALDLMVRMRQKAIEPNVVTHSAVLSACDKAHQWQWTLQQWVEMKESGIRPNRISYSAILGSMGIGLHWPQSLFLLDEMWHRKVSPDVRNYTMALSSLEKAKQWQLAVQLLNSMRLQSLQPDLFLGKVS